MLEKVKTALRIKTDAFDVDELAPLIEACKADLKRVGVLNVDDKVTSGDALLTQAVILYCKSYFGKSEAAERNRTCYEMIRDGMALMTDGISDTTELYATWDGTVTGGDTAG